VTKTRKYIIEKLLDGYYLRSWKSVGGVPCYRLYDPDGNPELSVMQSTIDKLDRHIDPKIKIWRVVKPGKITLNLAMVRRLHGSSYIKRAYKQLKIKA
jgi:hypothetical protein